MNNIYLSYRKAPSAVSRNTVFQPALPQFPTLRNGIFTTLASFSPPPTQNGNDAKCQTLSTSKAQSPPNKHIHEKGPKADENLSFQIQIQIAAASLWFFDGGRRDARKGDDILLLPC